MSSWGGARKGAGRPKAPSPKHWLVASRYARLASQRAVAEDLGVSRSTVRRGLKEWGALATRASDAALRGLDRQTYQGLVQAGLRELREQDPVMDAASDDDDDSGFHWLDSISRPGSWEWHRPVAAHLRAMVALQGRTLRIPADGSMGEWVLAE